MARKQEVHTSREKVWAIEPQLKMPQLRLNVGEACIMDILFWSLIEA